MKKSTTKSNSKNKNNSTRKHVFGYKICVLVELFFLIDFLHEAALKLIVNKSLGVLKLTKATILLALAYY